MDKDHPQKSAASQVDVTRRRLTKAGLAAPAVLGTLASQKVLADAPWNCTVSGQISGNISRPGAVACSTVGQGFSAYNANGTNWPPSCSNYFPTTGNGCNFNQALDFSAVPALLTTKFQDAFTMPQGNGTSPATVLEVYSGAAGLASLSANISLEFGREALLALFNAYKNPTSNSGGFPLSPEDVVYMFNAIFDTGSYNTGIPGAKPWNGETVLWYWKSLHPNT